jgi:uncharacterized integral membrane protein
MKLFTYLVWLVRGLLFLLLLVLVAKNMDPVTLHFFLGRSWEMPLTLALLVFLLLGVVLGVLACSGRWFRQRREILGLRRELRAKDAGNHASPAAKT